MERFWQVWQGRGVSKPLNTLATMCLFLAIACTGRRDKRWLYLQARVDFLRGPTVQFR